MKTLLLTAILGLFVGQAQANSYDDYGNLADPYAITTPEQVKWMPAPAVLEKGAEIAVLQGDMSKEGLWTARLKLPANFIINPHWHNGAEALTVISGEFGFGMGNTFSRKEIVKYPAGTFMSLPAGHHHFVYTAVETVIQLTSTTPFDVTYINPKHDPRNRKP